MLSRYCFIFTNPKQTFERLLAADSFSNILEAIYSSSQLFIISLKRDHWTKWA